VIRTRVVRAFCLVCVACCIGAAQAMPVQIIDDAGQRLEFATPPQRIVSLTPHLTELLFAAGAGAQVVGIDAASDYPEAARKLPRVGDYSRIRLERILALQPDLIVAWIDGNRAADLHGVARLGIPVLFTRARRLDDVARLLLLLGRVSGQEQTAAAAARDFRERLRALEARSPEKPPVKVFYQIWGRPLITVGGHHWISEALALCGARNLFHDLGGVAPVISREAVLRRAPDVIASSADVPGVRAEWETYTALPAVRKGAFVSVDADRLHRASPRLVEGVATLCEALADYVR